MAVPYTHTHIRTGETAVLQGQKRTGKYHRKKAAEQQTTTVSHNHNHMHKLKCEPQSPNGKPPGSAHYTTHKPDAPWCRASPKLKSHYPHATHAEHTNPNTPETRQPSNTRKHECTQKQESAGLAKPRGSHPSSTDASDHSKKHRGRDPMRRPRRAWREARCASGTEMSAL